MLEGTIYDPPRKYYDGSRLLLPVAERLNHGVDKFNFAVMLFCSIACSLAYRRLAAKWSLPMRQTYHGLLGFLMLYFAFGSQIKHLIALSLMCYFAMATLPRKNVHQAVFCLAMGYLTLIHYKRFWIDTGGRYFVDISGPLMMVTQKTIYLGFGLRDVLWFSEEELARVTPQDSSDTSYQNGHATHINEKGHSKQNSGSYGIIESDFKRFAVVRCPSLLEYFAFIFSFMNCLCGPSVQYLEFDCFIKGKPIPGQEKVPADDSLATKAFVVAILQLVISIVVVPYLPVEYVWSQAFYSSATPFWRRIATAVMSLHLAKVQYYFIWKMAECSNRVAGMGELSKNINIGVVESTSRFSHTINNWNMSTNRWLRYVVYLRAPKYQMPLTMISSAFWHGLSPGYYVAFINMAIMLHVARSIRYFLWPVMEGNAATALLYKTCSFFMVKYSASYAMAGFVLLEWQRTVDFYSTFYWHVHLLSLLLFLLAITVGPRLRRREKTE